MPRVKKVKEVEEVAEVVAEEVAVEAPKSSKFPEVAGNGKFQAVVVGKGLVVYNPAGQRVSDVLPENEANSIVLSNNMALGK